MKKYIVPALMTAAVVILGGISIFIAVRLYNQRNVSVAPNVPESVPVAATPATTSCETISVTFATETATATATATATSTATATATATATSTASSTATPTVFSCNQTCNTNAQCQSGNTDYICYSQTGTCRNKNYPDQSNCLAPATTNSPNPTIPPDVPESGVALPTILGAGAGILLILGAIIFAL